MKKFKGKESGKYRSPFLIYSNGSLRDLGIGIDLSSESNVIELSGKIPLAPFTKGGIKEVPLPVRTGRIPVGKKIAY
jgi:hypothetical protein